MIHLNKNLFIFTAALVLFGAGCKASLPANTSSGQYSDAQPSKTTNQEVVPEADFVKNLMENKSTWITYENKEAGVIFRYPAGFFTEAKKYGDQSSGMYYAVNAKPTSPEDGVCNGLGDRDCEIATWPIRYKNFLDALKGSKYSYGGYEAVPVTQGTRVVGGMKFLNLILQGINGACLLAYVRATPSAYVSFEVNICDDPQLKTSLWQGDAVDQNERRKAANILAGKNLSDSTRRKIESVERVISTLKIEK